ncbi:diguanylate cyclase [Candidatus Koribacter versatilis Ellin345]|uniref:diguanylate cyclase n=1 Tax=Koribacter versatilis (strain Ellin345) TaxID=204669 RepID=Q1IRY3_KORVE|nr:GGDEF domain-containing protein [Candidatus Koribacter versatilis]ABF40367.1 diguanylate cyclase [Candidatus Koribacter versatilis Ellin345]
MNLPTPQLDASQHSKGMLASLSQQLASIEKRDTELWLILLSIGAMVGGCLLLVLAPAAFLRGGQFHFEVSISKESFFGLIALLTIANGYIVTRRFQYRKVRQQLISSTIQNELVRLQSFTDPLTEVYNRRSLDDMAGRYISSARRRKTDLTFMLIDVDKFRQVNSKFGHLTGDVVLAEVAALLRTSVRGSDAVVRYGGDEFLIILPESTAEHATHVVDRINRNLTDWNHSGQLKDFELSLSIGVAQWKDGATLDETLDAADHKMYAMKGAQTAHSK